MPGLARLVALAEGQGVRVPVVPVGLAYSSARPAFGDRAALAFGPALYLQGEGRAAAAGLNADLAAGLERAEVSAREAVGRNDRNAAMRAVGSLENSLTCPLCRARLPSTPQNSFAAILKNAMKGRAYAKHAVARKQ